MREYVLSIDASLSCTGYAVLDKDTKDIVDVNKITTTSKIEEGERIFNITNELTEVMDKYDIKEVVMEDQFLGKNAKTAMQLSRLRGAIDFAVRLKGYRIEYIQPPLIKKIFTGLGNASKEDVANRIIEVYKDNIYVQALGPFNDKQNKQKNSDMYDAISIGSAYLTQSAQVVLVKGTA